MNLRLDATCFKQFCLLCYQDDADGYTQLIRFTDSEHTEQIKEDLNNLIHLGIQIVRGSQGHAILSTLLVLN